MPLNIIVRDGRSREQKQRKDYADKIIKGYYNEECNGTYRTTNHGSKVNIRDGWKDFEHEKFRDPGDGNSRDAE